MNLFRGQIYCIICLPTGKWYFGQTVKNLEKRFKEHKQAESRGVDFSLYRAIRKYGVENFTVEEVMWVKASTKGALKGKTFSKEHRQKISEAKRGVKRKPFSEEWKKKLSESHFGNKNHFFGKKHSEDSRRKMFEAKNRRRVV